MNNLKEMFCSKNPDTLYDRCFPTIFIWYNDVRYPFFARQYSCRQYPPYTLDPSIKGKFTSNEIVGNGFLFYDIQGGEDSHCYWQVKGRAFLPHICRGKVYR